MNWPWKRHKPEQSPRPIVGAEGSRRKVAAPLLAPAPPHGEPQGRPVWWAAPGGAMPAHRLLYPDDSLNQLLE